MNCQNPSFKKMYPLAVSLQTKVKEEEEETIKRISHFFELGNSLSQSL